MQKVLFYFKCLYPHWSLKCSLALSQINYALSVCGLAISNCFSLAVFSELMSSPHSPSFEQAWSCLSSLQDTKLVVSCFRDTVPLTLCYVSSLLFFPPIVFGSSAFRLWLPGVLRICCKFGYGCRLSFTQYLAGFTMVKSTFKSWCLINLWSIYSHSTCMSLLYIMINFM